MDTHPNSNGDPNWYPHRVAQWQADTSTCRNTTDAFMQSPTTQEKK